MTHIPPGPKDIYCPLWRKPMCKVCHTCAFYVKGESINQLTGARSEKWSCAIPMGVILQSETKTQIIQNGAATESLRNELCRASDNTLAAAETFQAVQSRRDPKLIDLTPRGKA
jgi:hypothetical protein